MKILSNFSMNTALIAWRFYDDINRFEVAWKFAALQKLSRAFFFIQMLHIRRIVRPRSLPPIEMEENEDEKKKISACQIFYLYVSI